MAAMVPAAVRYQFRPVLVEADLPKGTTKVPVQVVLPAYLHRQMRNVKLHVTKGRKISED